MTDAQYRRKRERYARMPETRVKRGIVVVKNGSVNPSLRGMASIRKDEADPFNDAVKTCRACKPFNPAAFR